MVLITGAHVDAQPVPQPFPKPSTSQAQPPATRPGAAVPGAPRAAGSAAPPAPQTAQTAPTEASLGVPIYPTARFLASYDAGRGQRYYLFGATAPFADLVTYYRNVLKNRGDVVYEEPPVHIFETGRFREETMAFPPSVAVKDYTWGGIEGYLVPLPGGKSQRYPTIIQIVPVLPGDAR